MNTKVTNRIPRCSETVHEVCGECFHAMSNHTITCKMDDGDFLRFDCVICKCKNCSWG